MPRGVARITHRDIPLSHLRPIAYNRVLFFIIRTFLSSWGK